MISNCRCYAYNELVLSRAFRVALPVGSGSTFQALEIPENSSIQLYNAEVRGDVWVELWRGFNFADSERDLLYRERIPTMPDYFTELSVPERGVYSIRLMCGGDSNCDGSILANII